MRKVYYKVFGFEGEFLGIAHTFEFANEWAYNVNGYYEEYERT